MGTRLKIETKTESDLKSLIFIGCSHTNAIRFSADARQTDGFSGTLNAKVVHLRDKLYRPEDYGATEKHPLGSAIVNYLSAPDNADSIFVSCLHGNVHNVLGLMRHPRPFDFVLPERPDLPLISGAETIPYGFILQRLRNEVRQESNLLAALKALVGTLYHIESPPPVRSEKHILEYADSYFANRAIDSIGVSPEWLRFKMWRTYSQAVREACLELGVIFIPTPHAVCDKDGFLSPEGYAKDATHANAWYGEHVVRSFEAMSQPKAVAI